MPTKTEERGTPYPAIPAKDGEIWSPQGTATQEEEMELDLHYYMVYKLAVLAGFDESEAEVIAYASQYVDDATESEPVQINGFSFDTVRTAHYKLAAFSWNVQKKIYMPFHFIPSRPGGASAFSSKRPYSYVTRKATDRGSVLTGRLFNSAEQEEDPILRPIRLGIALHTIADTFAHYGFSGRWDSENNVGGIWFRDDDEWDYQTISSRFYDAGPQIGHLEAGNFPDTPHLYWKYENGKDRDILRNNVTDSLECAKHLYALLKTANAQSDENHPLDSAEPEAFAEIRRLIKMEAECKVRCREWRRHTGARKYDKTYWRKLAFSDKTEWDWLSPPEFMGLNPPHKRGFDKSLWANFHRAARKQRCLVLGWIFGSER
ncbi:DUF6765 family protein [Thermodesulfobacteriota bacterium]